jgi:F-type H+-transporting ATPase subunit gamma
MATIREIKRRITAIKSTRKITRAMQLVAAAKLRRAQENTLKLRPYALGFERVMAQVAARTQSDIHPLLAGNKRGRRFLLILVTGDSGLSGGFNANVIRATRVYIAEHEGCERLDLYCVGRKGRDFFVKTRPPVAGQKVNFFNRLKFADAVQVVSDITGLYLREGYDRVDILYHEFGSAIRQVLTIKQFLPFVPAKPEGNIPFIDHLYEPDVKTVLSSLIPANLEVQMWRIFLESYAAEMGAKMTAMDAATENADDLLSILSVRYNRARQAQITRELTEIVGGAESIG